MKIYKCQINSITNNLTFKHGKTKNQTHKNKQPDSHTHTHTLKLMDTLMDERGLVMVKEKNL